MKRSVLAVVFSVIVLVGCNGQKEAQELSKTNFNGNLTIEAAMNGIAGLDGSVSYFMPMEQPENSNFRNLGVTIARDNQKAEYVILVDKAKNVSQASTITFGGYKMVFNNKGNLEESREYLSRFYTWGGMSKNEVSNLIIEMILAGVLPEIVPVSR